MRDNPNYSRYYKFHRLLGHGAFCSVYSAEDIKSKELIAVKVIKRKTLNPQSVQLLKKESELLQSIEHENVVGFKHVSFKVNINLCL